MKLIEALKQSKDLLKKADDIKAKVALYCAYPSLENPVYPDQPEQVRQWIQAYEDILKEILRLRIGVQKTNIQTNVTIELGGKQVTKTIAEWIHRRRDLAEKNQQIWGCISDRGLKEGQFKTSAGELVSVKIVRCYEPKQRDEKIDLYNGEPSLIDQKLEIVNAVTDMIE